MQSAVIEGYIRARDEGQGQVVFHSQYRVFAQCFSIQCAFIYTILFPQGDDGGQVGNAFITDQKTWI